MALPHERITEMHERRAAAIARAREIHQAAADEGRDLTDEETSQYEAAIAEARRLKETVTREERIRDEESSLEDLEQRGGRVTRASVPDEALDDESEELEQDRDRRGRSEWLADEWPREFRGMPLPEERREFEGLRLFLRQLSRGALRDSEQRALDRETRASIYSDSINAGMIGVPTRFVAGVYERVRDETFVVDLAENFPSPNGESLGVVTVEKRPDDAEWTSEIKAVTADTALEFGGRELAPADLKKLLIFSNKLAGLSRFPLEAFLRNLMAYKIAVTKEKAAMTGNGTKQALGIFTPSAVGISTSRDVVGDNTTSAVKPDSFIRLKHKLKQTHRRRARAILHPDIVLETALWKDQQNRYLLMPALRVGEVDRIANIPIAESEFAPSTLAASAYVGAIGDFSTFWWADSDRLNFRVLRELYALSGKTGLLAETMSDGMPIDEEGFARWKMAAS